MKTVFTVSFIIETVVRLSGERFHDVSEDIMLRGKLLRKPFYRKHLEGD
jgi:hypothetical protein